MTTVTVGGNLSVVHQQMQQHFEELARDSFHKCVEELLKLDFYKAVERRFERGVGIEDDVPEAVGQSPAQIAAVVLRLKNRAAGAVNDAWELPPQLKQCFATTVRSRLPENELYPQYDVEHVGKTDAGEVKVRIRTIRRSIAVEVLGSEAAVGALWGEMVIAVAKFGF